MNHDSPPKSKPTRRVVLGLAGGTGLASVLAEASQSDDRQFVSPQARERVSAIDTHIHVVPPRLPGLKPIPKEIEDLYNRPPTAMAARLKTEFEQAKIEFALGMGSLDGPRNDPLGVAGMLELCPLVPGLKVIGVADPRRNERAHLLPVEAQIAQHRDKLVAFKAYLGYLHFGPEDARYVPYYKLAEKYHLPVVFHTGDNWSTKAKVKFAHPLRLDEVAVDFPEARFIIAHFGNPG
jgi:hypothetical protein